MIKTHVFDRIYTLSPRPSSKALRKCTHSEQVNCFVLKKRRYLVTKALVVRDTTADGNKSRENLWQAWVLHRGETAKTARLPIFEKQGEKGRSNKNASSSKIMCYVNTSALVHQKSHMGWPGIEPEPWRWEANNALMYHATARIGRNYKRMRHHVAFWKSTALCTSIWWWNRPSKRSW